MKWTYHIFDLTIMVTVAMLVYRSTADTNLAWAAGLIGWLAKGRGRQQKGLD